ncbi:MAG: PIN domain nuclease [Burkholderiaceae bacterium]
MRVVIDPGLVLRALVRPAGEERALRRAWQGGLIRPLVSPTLATVLMRALSYPALGLGPAQQQELLADFLPYAEVVKPAPAARIRALTVDQQALVDLSLQGMAAVLLCDAPSLSDWAARSRSPAARQLCEVRSTEAWIGGLSPSQRGALLC